MVGVVVVVSGSGRGGASYFGVTVPRLCRIRSDGVADELPFPLDEDGFLAPPRIEPSDPEDDDIAGRLLPLWRAVCHGAVVLLGEPGLGKSTEFSQLIEQADAGVLVVEPVDGADLGDPASFEELVGRHLRSLPTRPVVPDVAAGPRGALPSTILIIDQVDESPMLQQLAGCLRRAARGRDTSGLRLVLGCRTADYPANLTAVLTSVCGSCWLADLAPLTRAQATALAWSVPGIDGDGLVVAAIACGAGALANVPLTLELLANTYRVRGSLDAPPTELFAEGVLQLLDEHDTERGPVNVHSTPSQRLAVAQRIAVRLVLSGRRTIWCGHALRAGAQDVDANAFAVGEETCDGGIFQISPRIVNETLAAGLFTGRGTSRLAFRHASFAAYLAARYLVQYGVPAAQLRRLFLMPFGRTAHAVPVVLRETAAWLVNAATVDIRWLVEADPESLVPHSPLVDSPPLREVLVAAMLHRAGELEAGPGGWAWARRRLAHPALGRQLLEVLADPNAGPPQDWDSYARVRVAVRLARDVDANDGAELIERLLQLAEHDAWDASTRTLAASAAFAGDPDDAAQRLRLLLRRFDDTATATASDPDGEIRGGILRLLWPRHLTTAEVLPSLRQQSDRTFIGSLRMFRLAFAESLPERDLGIVLQWAADEYSRDEQSGSVRDAFDAFVDELVDRALSASSAQVHVSAVGTIVRHLVEQYKPIHIPRAVDLVDAHGQEPAHVCTLRRALAHELIRQWVEAGRFDRGYAWSLIERWTHPRYRQSVDDSGDGLRPANRSVLLDSRDFVWLYTLTTDTVASGQNELAEAFAAAAALLFDLADDESATLASRNETHPVWTHVAWWFEPVSVDSELAQQWRKTRRANEPEIVPVDIAAVNRRVQELFIEAEAGEPEAFWRLAFLLQRDPETADGELQADDDLLTFPGTALLPDDHPDRLTEAGLRYLCANNDHADEWLGRGVLDTRAWAGNLAMSLLYRRNRLGELPADRWPHWIHALIDAHPNPSAGGDLKPALLAAAARHAPQRLADCAQQYVRAELGRSSSPFDVRSIDPRWAPQIADAWTELAAEISAAITGADPGQLALASDDHRAIATETWETLVSALLATEDPRGVELAIARLTEAGDAPATLVLAGRAGRALLNADCAVHLGVVLAACESHPPTSCEVALALGTVYNVAAILDRLSVEQLVDIYRWLSTVFPEVQDAPPKAGFAFVGPDEQARRWRDAVPQVLATLGTAEAVDALTALRDTHPDRLVLLHCLGRARWAAAAERWRAPEPADIAKLLDDATRRFARTDTELRDVLLELLDQIGADLPHHGDLLWNHQPKGSWRPKYEYALQAYIAHELDLRLTKRGILVNREVMIKPTDPLTGAGERCDILVQATTRRNTIDGPTSTPITVVIEIKCSWNKGILHAQRTQLANRYLPEAASTAGIYLVGWYPLEPWDTEDPNKTAAARHSKQSLLGDLNLQAEDITASGNVTTVPYLLNVQLPERLASEPAAAPARKQRRKT